MPAADLFSRVARVAAARPGAVAIDVDGAGGGSWSYGRLVAGAVRFSAELARRGLRRGDRVAVLLESRPEVAVVLLAVAHAGAAFLPVHTGYRRREIAHLLVDAEPRFVVTEQGFAERLAELSPDERPGVEAVLVLEELAAPWTDDRSGVGARSPSAAEGGPAGSEALAAMAPLAALTPLQPLTADDLALLLYTSGTTGQSKGAMLSHGNVLAMVRSLHEAWAWSPADRLLVALPLFHLHGLLVGLLTALTAGAAVRLLPRFDAARVVDQLAAGEATLYFGVPTHYVRLVEELERRGGRVDFSAVRLFVSGSAPLAVETFEAFRAATGHAILERYGMTETGMLFGNPLGGPRLAGTVGVPLPGVEARLVDAHGAAVPLGAPGEVEVRGPGVFGGYFRAPEKSAASFRADAAGGRWFRTGDLGAVDPASGHLRLLARASELILSGGFNVYPREIEEVLLALPGVHEAAVVAEPHPEFGESPVAYLVAAPGLSIAQLDAHCRAQLAPFKLPRRFVQVAALPRNALGKVEKHRLAGTIE